MIEGVDMDNVTPEGAQKIADFINKLDEATFHDLKSTIWRQSTELSSMKVDLDQTAYTLGKYKSAMNQLLPCIDEILKSKGVVDLEKLGITRAYVRGLGI